MDKNYIEIPNELINELQGILNLALPDVDRDIIDDIKADTHEALCKILKEYGLIDAF